MLTKDGRATAAVAAHDVAPLNPCVLHNAMDWSVEVVQIVCRTSEIGNWLRNRAEGSWFEAVRTHNHLWSSHRLCDKIQRQLAACACASPAPLGQPANAPLRGPL